MYKTLLLLLLTIFVKNNAFAQFTTPNTGVLWTLEDLLESAPDAFTLNDGIYTLSENLTIAEQDSLVINENASIRIDAGVLVTIEGYFSADAEQIVITASDITAPYEGFDFRDTSTGYFKNCTITYGGGIRVLTDKFEMDSCTVSYHSSGISTGAAISFSQGSPIVKNSTLNFNALPAFSSGGNQRVSAHILNNYLEGNNTSNTNRPQINMSATGNDTLRIVGNTIKGDRTLTRVGGISASSLLGDINTVIIENNIITDNRYGITVQGARSTGYIRGNIIEDNNTENNPAVGGSGISLSTSGEPTMNIIATNNQIRRNLWGITVIGNARINLGNTDPEAYNPGGNIFSENGNGGAIYALYNNTPHTIYAMNNCWIEDTELTPENVESVISHKVDDTELGEVIFTPFGCETLSAPVFTIEKPIVYPNPSNGEININITENGQLEIYNISGQLVANHNLNTGNNQLQVDLPSGIYVLKTSTENKNFTEKLVIK